MNEQEIQQLKQVAEEAELTAATAEAEAQLDPTNAAKLAATKIAASRADEAKKKWRIAAMPPVSPSDWRVILLGVYLALTMFASVYLLATLTMAEPPGKTVGDLRIACCGSKNEYCDPLQTPTPTPGSIVNEAVNTKPASNSSIAGNANQTANNTSNNSTAANIAANSATNNSNADNTIANLNKANASNSNSAANTAANKIPAANTNSGFQQEIIEPTIPAVVCVNYFNRLPADGYLFLVVLFAGMVGAVARGIFSFVRHQGENDFSFSWTWFYLFLPFSGAIVSLFLYFIIRGGFYGSPVGKSLVLNLFAFIALGTLSGLFAENAMEKLRQVAEVLLAKVPPKVDAIPEAKETDKQK